MKIVGKCIVFIAFLRVVSLRQDDNIQPLHFMKCDRQVPRRRLDYTLAVVASYRVAQHE